MATTGLRTDDFDYELPADLIAQHPPAERDGGRLLQLCRATGRVTHHRVRELPRLLPRGALLVINDTAVIPARLRGRRATGGRVELLLIERVPAASAAVAGDPERWVAMLRASKRPRAGERLLVASPEGAGAEVLVVEPLPEGRAVVELPQAGVVERCGSVPLPPYIEREASDEDRVRYQTVYARHRGSVAAPTAGLHLTEALLREIEAAGVELARITLHVGPGTFTPVRAELVDEHRMEGERARIPDETARAVLRARDQGRPVIAVGTTSVRALESTGGQAGELRTELFIRPGYAFRAVDGMLTNFHLPRSTLVMLVSALAGREQVLAAYREAVAQRYRFYSYGDAMLIL